ncbi:Alpha/Beta hydrolase protein [Xylariaceae sp. FL0594]|nr:Alpha/Beta hydrolase protein [Xylariaceae sp. FL0594]
MALSQFLAAVSPLLFTGAAWPLDILPGVPRHGTSGCGSDKNLGSGRTYQLWVPPTYTPGKVTPLILSFHGAGGTPDTQADLDLLTTPFFNKDHIVVYPSSLEYDVAPYRFWQGAPQVPPDVDDIGYVMDVLDDVESRLCVDTSRIYATGKSQGGMLANSLACDEKASARIAAFAPVSGSYYVNATGSDCKPAGLNFRCAPDADRKGAIPMLFFHGGSDDTIPYDGGERSGECLPDVPYFVSEWAVREGMHSEPQRVLPLEGAGDHAKVYAYGSSGSSRHHKSGGKKDDAEDTLAQTGLVTLVFDGNHVNHQWPATIPNSDSVKHRSDPASFNASSLIMDFFNKYAL